uniref:C2H2-type domain-containing protein n=1 Tax=Nothobranchius kadleci TaxID=1051664 RepID=A0A1A8CLS5_NOTKA
MAETLLTFQSQLSGVMETVFKAALYEITRLVEDSFVEEVTRYRSQVQVLKKRLKRQEERKERCADCGRVGLPDENKPTETEKVLKQESVLHEVAPGSLKTTAETRSEEIEEANPEVHGSMKTTQTSGVQVEKSDKIFKEEALQNTPEVSGSREWGLSTGDASSLPGPSKPFSLQSSKGQVNWETGFDQRPSSQGGSPEPLFQNRYGINELDDFDKTGHRDNNAINMADFGGLRDSPTHLADDLNYAGHHNEDLEAPSGSEHQCFPAGSTQNKKSETSAAAASPLRTNEGRGEFSCFLIDEEGYLQDPNVRYADQVSGESGGRVNFHGQGVRFNPSLDGTNMYEASDAFSGTLNLEHGLQHQTVGGGGRSSSNNQGFTSFPESGSLKTNNQTHRDTELEPLYSCNQHTRTTAQACHPKVHQRTHTGPGLHLCNHCGKGFSSFVDLKTHKCCQTVDKPYCCAVCGNKFSRLWNLKLHQRIHTQEKPHRCNMCDKSFTRADILKVHQRIHTGERPYCCALCGQSFKRLDHLKTHRRKHVTAL